MINRTRYSPDSGIQFEIADLSGNGTIQIIASAKHQGSIYGLVRCFERVRTDAGVRRKLGVMKRLLNDQIPGGSKKVMNINFDKYK